MDYDADKVQQDPLASVIPGDTEPLVILFFCLYRNLIGDRPGLSVAGAGGDDKVIRCRTDSG